jgi:protein-disulfide isomerase
VAKFAKALDSHKFRAKVNAHKAEAASLGARGTPAFFINGVSLGGAQPFPKFKGIIDAELAALKDGKRR